MEEKIKDCLAEVRLMLQNDGGDLDVIAIEGRVVRVRLLGACSDCPHADLSIEGVGALLRCIDAGITIERV